MTKIVASTMLAIAGLFASPGAAQTVIEEQASLDELIDSYVDEGAFPLIYVRVEDREGNIVYERGVNNPQLVPGETIDGDSWLRIWSMSKMVTITAALDMIEDGLLTFDDPVSNFIPEFDGVGVAVGPSGDSLFSMRSNVSAESAVDWNSLECPFETTEPLRAMTVRDLLNHTAGFYYGVTEVPCLNAMVAEAALPQAETSDDLIARLAKLPLIQHPGEGYYYGTNTTVLGLVMERASGKALPAIIEERVTGPLGIANLRYGLPQGAVLAPRYIGDGGVLRLAEPAELDIFASPPPGYDPESRLYLGGEGMVATSAAYADFLHMLLGRGAVGEVRILDEMTIEALTSPQTQTDNPWGHNGWNLWINSGLLANGEQGVGGLWIGGGYEGTAFWVDPENGLIGMINTQVYKAPEMGHSAVETIREAIYARLVIEE